MSFRFGKKSTKDKIVDQVEPAIDNAADKASDTADKVRKVVLDALGDALAAAKPKVDKAAEKTTALAQDAYGKANVAAHDAYDRARPLMQDAYGKANVVAHDAYARANVAAHDTYEKARPYLEDATKRAEVATENLRDDYLPRARRAANAAIDEARSGSGDLQTRAKDVVKVSRKELEKPEKKKGRGRKLLGFLAVAGVGAAAAYYAWARSKPVSDPWAEAYWEDVSVPQDKVDEPVDTPEEDLKDNTEGTLSELADNEPDAPIADADAPLGGDVEVDEVNPEDHLNVDGSSDEEGHVYNEKEAADAAGLTDPEDK
ncbi:MAG: hypothetical protein GX037_07290 [Trueperella sp.]|nr:hypothetical protein [Trueperella sp.]